MIDRSAFRRITPAALWPWFPPGAVLIDENLVWRHEDGSGLLRGKRTGKQLVLLQGEAVMDNDPARETRMLGRVLSLLKLPLQPWAAFGETTKVFEQLCPRLMWGLTPRGEGKPNAPGLWNRTLLALRNGLYIEVRFWQDRLDDIIVLDVDLWFLNTDVTAWEEAWEAAARENKLADFYASLLPIFMDNSVSAKPSTIEWSRGFGPPELKRPCRPESLQGLNGGDFKASSVNNG